MPRESTIGDTGICVREDARRACARHRDIQHSGCFKDEARIWGPMGSREDLLFKSWDEDNSSTKSLASMHCHDADFGREKTLRRLCETEALIDSFKDCRSLFIVICPQIVANL